MTNRQIIILAGGKGTRMNIDGPKVLVPLNGKPMIQYVLDAIQPVQQSAPPFVVIGFEADQVKQVVGPGVTYVMQSEQRGTGHAVACCRPLLEENSGAVVVLYADHPLITAQTVEKLFTQYEATKAAVTLATTTIPDFNDWRQEFYAFGRILRDASGAVVGIRELKDCSETEKEIREVNPGYYCFDSLWLWTHIDQLKDKNAQRELYITDLVEIAQKESAHIETFVIDPVECLGVNTVEQVQLVEKQMGS